MKELEGKDSAFGLELRKFSHRKIIVRRENPGGSSENYYVTLLNSTTFVDHTKNRSIFGAASERTNL